MIKFDEDPDLGKVIKSKSAFSFGVKDVKNLKDIILAGGGHKFSKMCGFDFVTAAPNHPYPKFRIIFNSTSHSKIVKQKGRGWAAPSMWFIWKPISANTVEVLDKKLLLQQYGFDVDKFMKSDYMQRMIPKFYTALKKGLKSGVEFTKKERTENPNILQNGREKDNPYFMARSALGTIKKVIVDGELDIGKVNDKYYKLINYDK